MFSDTPVETSCIVDRCVHLTKIDSKFLLKPPIIHLATTNQRQSRNQNNRNEQINQRWRVLHSIDLRAQHQGKHKETEKHQDDVEDTAAACSFAETRSYFLMQISQEIVNFESSDSSIG